jgi:hypothetical protein
MNALEPLASSTEVDLIVAAVFQAMLGLEVEPAGEVQPSEPAQMNATVHLGGTWDGALMLETSRSQACRLAGRFLSIDPPPSVDDNVRDVMGALANMIAGNLKCALAPAPHSPCRPSRTAAIIRCESATESSSRSARFPAPKACSGSPGSKPRGIR